ncbi:MAG: DUF3857 domain-containing protein, partial [Marinirhabdus sp.]|nr:DUF3857 domain-containing protein [Marinirhabdus sp.]
MKYVFYCLFFLAFASSISVAQERKFGDVTKEELAATSDDVFPDESAIILYREIEFEYGKTLWVHERIKILNKEGFDYSDWTISFDDIRQLKAVTYNLVDGKIEETKVGKQSIFVEEVDKDNEISKLAFPNVKEGSIIELKYKVIFIGLSALYTQMKLPIKYERISVSNGYYGQLSVRQNQYVQLPIKRLQAAQTDIFVGENVPGLKDEEFVGNINNHRGSILMELHRTNYVQTWTEVAKKFYEAEWFGAQMRNGDALYKKDLESLLAGVTDTLTMVKMVDRYVKDKIEWDQTYSRGTEYVKSVYRDEKGDSGDINLLLVHMLKSLGIRADPILVATKNKGWVNYPKAEEFNAVLCAVDVGNMRYILDGSVKETAFAQLPLRYINGTGLIVRTDAPGFDLQEVTIVQPTNQMVIATANIHPEKLAVSGNVNQRLTNYFALSHRRKYTDVGQNRYANYLSDVSLLNVSNITDENFDDINEPIKLSYDYEQS